MELNSQEIQKLIPHRYPFLLVDRITACEPGESASGIKCVSANEMQFLGHFPGNPIMPGVLILEAMAQVGAVCILSLPENRGKLAVFGGVKEARFRRQVVPGDVLEMTCEIVRRMGPVGIGKATARVGGQLAATAELSFALTEPENTAE